MRRLLFPLFWLLEFPLVAAGAVLLAFWIWSGTEGSLKSTLEQAQPYLPAGHSLQLQDVTGSLRGGGHIGSLRWQNEGLTVQARKLTFAWQPGALMRRKLSITRLDLAEVTVDDQRKPSPTQPLQELVLPLDIELAFDIARLHLTGASTLDISTLAGRYRYDSSIHQIELERIQLAQGRYHAQMTLQARSPMTLDLQLQGAVSAPIDEQRQIELEASATVRGQLAGTAPNLDLLAQVQPGAGNTGALAASRAMRATASAQVNPWAKQPVIQAQASFSQLNLAALWPTAPRTQLTGNTALRPVGPNWRAELNLINRAAGPWDKGQLPVDSVKALVDWSASQWSIQSLNAELGGGRIKLQGTLGDPTQISATSGWQGQLQLQGVNPALLHSQIEPVRLDGEVTAKAEAGGIAFDVDLQPSAQQVRGSVLRGLRLQGATAQGRWADGWLRVADLNVRTSDARAQGRFDLQIATRSATGRLRLVTPGAQAQVDGEFAARDGRGELTLKVTDAASLRQWLSRLPRSPDVLAQLDIRGDADLALRWTGGWESLLQEQDRGKALNVQGRLQSSRLSVNNKGLAAGAALRLSQLDATVSGTPAALSFKTAVQVARASQKLELQTSGAAARDASGNWQGSVDQLRLQAQDLNLPGPWLLSLGKPIGLRWTAAGADAGTLQVGASQAALTGPRPGVVELSWQPVVWQGASGKLVSKGSLNGIPMDWFTLFGNAKLEQAGLSGDLLFDGQWDLTLADAVALRASLARRSGDIRIQTDSAATAGRTSTVNAGIRELRLDVKVDGTAAQADFRWASERAGNAQARVSTQLTRTDAGLDWTPDNPLDASLRAQMPQVAVWSMLAPPGWRVRGTVDADLALTGTQRNPQWSGKLRADDLAVRSVVEGIEFGDGQLRATLLGQRLNIDSFSLQGAGGDAGGELNATGFATWQVASGKPDAALGAIELQLDVVAKALRVSARADRRLAVSGTLQALLAQSKMRIRGALTVDQALFILPDETAPSLGDDVVIVSRTPAAPTAPAADPGSTPAPDAGVQASSGIETDLMVTMNLGQDFRVRGRGIDTRVAGELTLRSHLRPGEAPVLTGELSTVGGQYRAYGQQLEIERGMMRFSGPYDNPSLNILAIRPKLTQRVGVEITGTALLPRVRLYAEPDLPEAEKLAWLVLGRSAAGGGAEAAVLQQAAMALLGGENSSGGFAGRLGLDELSVSGASDVGTSGAGAATVTLGKRISQNFYVAYERSLAGTLGTFSIFYDLSERFTLRASTGEKSAVDLIFKLSYD